MLIDQVENVEAKTIDLDGVKDAKIRVLIADEQGAPNFHMREMIVAPGGYTPRHIHEWEHECYIISGEGMMETPEGPKPVKAGDFVFVAPNDDHQFQNTGDEELKFLCLIPKPATCCCQ